MNTQQARTTDENAIRSIHQRMTEAWNAGDGSAFAAPFTEDADFVVFEGTHLKGRQALAEFTQKIFDNEVKDTRLEGEVKFVRFLRPELAVMHSYVRMAFAGEEKTSASRDSMQLTVAEKVDGEWRAVALMNARKITMEEQEYLDDLSRIQAKRR